MTRGIVLQRAPEVVYPGTFEVLFRVRSVGIRAMGTPSGAKGGSLD